jgi:hypothetical protein
MSKDCCDFLLDDAADGADFLVSAVADGSAVFSCTRFTAAS